MIIINNSNRVAYGTVGVAFDATVIDLNAPYDEIVTGTIPAGLVWTNGVISGTPTLAGISDLGVYFYDGTTYNVGIIRLVISEAPVATVGLSDSNLKAYGTVGQPLDVATEFTPEASKFVTSYTLQAGTLQTGLSFNLAGKITGLPLAAGVSALTIRVNQINAAGTTSYVDKSVQIIIHPAPRDRYALRANLELATRVLTFDGAAETPVFCQGEKVEILLATYFQGVRRYLPCTGLAATFKHFDVEEPVTLNVASEVVSTEYLETTVEFAETDFSDLLVRGTALTTTAIDGYLQLAIEDLLIRDLREYDVTSSSVETVTTGENHNDSFVFTLSSVWDVGGGWTDAPMTLDIAFTCPGDAALNMLYTRTFTLTKATNFTMSDAAGTTTQTEEPTDVDDWAVTLAITSITGNTTSITVATNLSAESQTIVTAVMSGTSDWVVTLTGIEVDSGGLNWDIKDSISATIYLYTLSPGVTKTLAQLGSDLTAALGVTVTCFLAGGSVWILGLEEANVDHIDDGINSSTVSSQLDPRSVTRAGCTVSARLRGLEGDNTYLRRISSLPTPVKVVRDH